MVAKEKKNPSSNPGRPTFRLREFYWQPCQVSQLCDHCLYLSSLLSWLIDVCIIKLYPATPKNISVKLYEVIIIF